LPMKENRLPTNRMTIIIYQIKFLKHPVDVVLISAYMLLFLN
jgi:hypothetical protein